MADEFVKNILIEWNLTKLNDIFRDNDIDKEVFDNMNANIIQTLIPSTGLRFKFERKYSEYKLPSLLEEINAMPIDIVDFNSFNKENINLQNISTPIQIASEFNSSSSTLTAASLSITSGSDALSSNAPSTIASRDTLLTSASSTNSNISDTQKNSLTEILKNSSRGVEIIHSYNNSKNFPRGLLCDIIIRNELFHNPDKRISSSRFNYWTEEILKVFPHEIKEVYYIPYSKDHLGNPISAKGKLWDKYINTRRLYRKIGLLNKKNVKSDSVEDTLTRQADDSVQDENIIWLKNNIQPWTTVEELWSNTSKTRNRNTVGTIYEYWFKTNKENKT